MKLAALGWNLLDGLNTTLTVVTDAKSFQRGFPATNIGVADPYCPAILRGRFVVTAGVNDKIDFNDGSVRAATLTAGTYLSPIEFAVMAAARMNVVSTLCQVYHHLGRFYISRSSGTCTLLPLTGANASTSALWKIMGFSSGYDRSAAASHTADYPAMHAPSDVILCGVAFAHTAHVSYVLRPGLSAGGGLAVSMGSTTAVSDVTYTAGGGGYDDEIVCIPYTSPATYTYVQLALTDPRRIDNRRSAPGYWYHGLWLDTAQLTDFGAVDYEWDSYSRQPGVRYQARTASGGQISISEVEPGCIVEVGFRTSPGLSPDEEPAMRALGRLGKEAKVIMSIDSAGEPHRDSIYGRLLEPASFQHEPVESKGGRWNVGVRVEALPLR